MFRSLVEEYYGDAVEATVFDSYSWISWPHFFLDCYVFSFATSLSASLYLAERIESEGEPAVDDFIGILESGTSDYPYDVLKDAGVDLATPAPIEAALEKLGRMMDDLESMMEE